MAITSASFKIRFPEFAAETDDRINMFIADAVAILNEVFWGDKYDLGLYYLTAHYLAFANKSAAGNTGAINAKSGQTVDGSSATYETMTPLTETSAYYASTSYGQRYVSMRRNLGIVAYVI